LFGVGFSLGGNVLLKLLADAGAQSPLAAAVAISAPFDLAACARALDVGGGWVALYRSLFLHTLKRKALEKLERYPGVLDERRIAAARGIVAFDDAVTAPVNGFTDAAHYYRDCSSGPRLHLIRVPTLAISADDDPLIPLSTLPTPEALGAQVSLLRTTRGGHVGFLGGSLLRPQFWAEEQALRFLEQMGGGA
jgi:predicted alpha/beta-fold hydrolase